MEILDIYNEDRELTGRTHKRGNPVREGDYILVVHVWIVNEEGEILIQKRQENKKIFPGMWDCAAAGAALSGDTSESAAIRETKEELDVALDMKRSQLVFTDKFSFGFDDIWLVRQDVRLEDIHLQKEEVDMVKWSDPDEILEMAEKGEFIKYYYLEKLLEAIVKKKTMV